MSPYAPPNKPKVGKLVSLQRIVQGVGGVPDLPAASRIVVKRIRETMHTDVAFLVTLAAQLESVPDRVPQDPQAEEAAFHADRLPLTK